MKLSTWAKQQGITYKTAYRMFRNGTLPIRHEQFQTGTIMVYPEQPTIQRVVLYGKVANASQKADLEKQLDRMRAFAATQGWVVSAEVTDIGSLPDGCGRNAIKLLADPTVTLIVVERQDQLAQFGFGFTMVSAALLASGRHIIVMNLSIRP